MYDHYDLGINTTTYVKDFYQILDNMIYGMCNAELSNSISYNFIVQMIPHHRAAIEMSSEILKYTTNPTLQDIACNIIKAQTKSIKSMLDALNCCKNVTNYKEELYQYQSKMNQIMQNMFENMSHAAVTNNVSMDYILEMIPHHEGAVQMCTLTLQYLICPELKPILQSIITLQKRGIKQLEDLLQTLEQSGYSCE